MRIHEGVPAARQAFLPVLRKIRREFLVVGIALVLTASCGGGSGSSAMPPPVGPTAVASPTIATAAAQNGAQLVTLTDAISGAIIYYTLDGSTPTTKSLQYLAPFLVASNLTLKSYATHTGNSDSAVASQSFAPAIPSGTLVWSDEFANSTGTNSQPDPAVWTYDTGNSGFGNHELETYCAWASTTSPCDSTSPNAYVGTDGYLHIVARHPSNGVYTSARMKSQGLFTFTYGRLEARLKIAEGQGLWPAFWVLGNDFATVNWPACGEQDIMEHINAPSPDWVAGSVHSPSFDASQQYPTAGQTFSASDWHTYGMIWSNGTISYYIDSPINIYATTTAASVKSPGVWPFDSNGGGFIILNLAVGGDWPGSPDATTPFPSEMLVDYVRVYTN